HAARHARRAWAPCGPVARARDDDAPGVARATKIRALASPRTYGANRGRAQCRFAHWLRLARMARIADGRNADSRTGFASHAWRELRAHRGRAQRRFAGA